MLKSTILRNVLALVLPSVAALAAAAPAQANIRKVQHGSSACSFSGHFIGAPPPAGTPGTPLAIAGTADSWMFSAHTSEYGSYVKVPHANTQQSAIWANLSCSVDRDLPLSSDGLSDLELRFIGAGHFPLPPGTTAQDVLCSAYSYRSDGSLAAYDTRTVNVPTLTVKNTYTVMDFGSAINASGSKGSISVKCQMPPDVGLYSIYSSEVDGISGN